MANYSSLHTQGEHADMVWTASLSIFQGLCQLTTESTSQEFWHPAVSEVCLGDFPSPAPSLRHRILVCGEGRSFTIWAAAWACGLELSLQPVWVGITWKWVCLGKRARITAIERPYWLSWFERREWIWKMEGEDRTEQVSESSSKNWESGSRFVPREPLDARSYSS